MEPAQRSAQGMVARAIQPSTGEASTAPVMKKMT
jgi:hypothetical protein